MMDLATSECFPLNSNLPVKHTGIFTWAKVTLVKFSLRMKGLCMDLMSFSVVSDCGSLSSVWSWETVQNLNCQCIREGDGALCSCILCAR